MAYRPLVLEGSEPSVARSPQAFGFGGDALALDDPYLAQFIRGGLETQSGGVVSTWSAMTNTAVFRSVSLISFAIGMLPLQLIDERTKTKADKHPLYRLLHREPNNWQTAFDFRSLLQLRALNKGNGYALIIRAGNKIVRLVPLDPDRVTPVQMPDWSVAYDYQPPHGGKVRYAPEEMFHLRGLSMDGINGLSLVHMAREAIGLANQTERAAARLFKNGAMVGAALTHPGKISAEAYDRLKRSLEEKYAGASNAHKSLILEEGMAWNQASSNAKDSQHLETRKHQIEEIARVFGVPRPLLMVDETSWGSGIEALGRFFVQHTLSPWFEAWQQAVERSLLVGAEKDNLSAKFNAGALLRGSTKDQADFFAKALGPSGSPGFMTPNEVRDLMDMAPHPDGNELNAGSNFLEAENDAEDVAEAAPAAALRVVK